MSSHPHPSVLESSNDVLATLVGIMAVPSLRKDPENLKRPSPSDFKVAPAKSRSINNQVLERQLYRSTIAGKLRSYLVKRLLPLIKNNDSYPDIQEEFISLLLSTGLLIIHRSERGCSAQNEDICSHDMVPDVWTAEKMSPTFISSLFQDNKLETRQLQKENPFLYVDLRICATSSFNGSTSKK
jgi:hypothetical protein